MWLSLVERGVRDAEAAGSNPVISTKLVLYAQKNSFNREIETVFLLHLNYFLKQRFLSPSELSAQITSAFF